ncbi:tyrosine-type recombinase/integrase [Photobacterium sanguinicancri]|uniref:tyrosine-type recombinase/integrase n=1 Tax=Photobacterium sanguinicancri TaxID=875932 RepID=UPI0026E3788D|nr:site-specific integrase [Photobacterium sanguinicancri]MDO6498884.1 site-specific integrase [Photobacterium sanguinicancri]
MPIHKLKDHKQWTHIGFNGKLQFRKPIDIPFVTYSNHLPCVEANAYIRTLVMTNKKQGTIRSKVHNINHLIRFVETQPIIIKFSQLTDSTFRLFIQSLQGEREANGELKRSNNTVISIARSCVDFLCFVQSFHDLINFIGTDKSNSIQIIEKTYKHKPEGYKGFIEGVVKTHSAFPTSDAKKKRHPVSADDALKIWNHIKTQPSKDKRKRDMALYTAMEQLGARVQELSLIKWNDYEDARRTGSLKLTTLKRRDDKTNRYIPVPSVLLRSFSDYGKVRKKVMKKKKVKHDFLFISLTTGNPLTADSWTTYINGWQKNLGIKGTISPHLWRHAFVTEKLKELILINAEINSKDDFRKHLLHTATFKQQLQQWTGHTNLSSLDTYIDLVFADLNGYTAVYNAVALMSSVKLVERQIEALEEQITSKEITATAALTEIKYLLNAFQADIDKCIDNAAISQHH